MQPKPAPATVPRSPSRIFYGVPFTPFGITKGGSGPDDASTVQVTRPRLPPLRPRPSAVPPSPLPPTFTVTYFSPPGGSGNADLLPKANGVLIDSPVFSSSGHILCTGNLSNWQVGYIQTIFVHFMRDEYVLTNVDWNVPTPIRDAEDVNVPAPWYSMNSHRSAMAGSPPVFVGMIDHPWHVAEWTDPRTSLPDSLVRSSRRLTLVAWLVAKNQTTNVTVFLKNVRWEINFTVNVDRSRPVGSRATNAGPGMSAPIVGEGQGGFTPVLSGAIYNTVVNRPARVSARGGTESTSSFQSRPALDTSASSLRLDNDVASTPATYSPRNINIAGAGAPLPPLVQLRLGQQSSAHPSKLRVHTRGANGGGFSIPILSAGIAWIRERVWALLERYAPSLVPILRQGVLNWLKERLGGALQAIIDFAARPVRAIGNVVSAVRQHFGNLVVWVRDAAARIARNDCGPISEAAEKIHQVFEGLAAPVVERVKHYADVVKGFFRGIRDRFLAPIWDVLRSMGGAIWEEIQRIGRWIWEQTRPVRDFLSSAWTWLKNLIGIGEGDEGQNGILQWFQRKASAAWDWVMARIEPFKRPLLIIAGVLVMLSPVGPIIAIGLAGAGILRGIQWIRQNLRSRTATVQQQSFLRGTILPGILGAINGVSGIVNGIANRITGALRRVVAGIDDLAAAVSSISILSFARGLIGWLADGFRGLLDWAIVGVQGVAEGIQGGLQRVGGFARRVIDFLEEIERLLRNFFRLVGGTFRRIWNAIPKCIRDPFVNFLIPLILRQIPFFSELAATPEAWQQTRTQVSTLLEQVFVNFDLLGAMRTAFGIIVRVLRIPVDLMGQLLDKAAQAWDLVLARPMTFITNALKAILRGIGFFARNFLSHLWFGIQGWLLNAVEQSGTGIRPPASWEPAAIFGFVLDMLGISLDHVLDLLARRVGRPIVDRIRRMINVLTGVWEWVKVAIEEGPAGLWRMVVERLGNLARMVLEAAVGWVMTRIFAIVSARLTAMAASAGLSSVLEAVVALYAAIRTAMEYARRIPQILINVFDGIIQIANGVLDPAAGLLERAFRNAMPIVIGFLANYAGLGGIGGRIREVVLDIRERVDNAILWLIDRALAAGRWLLDRLRAGVAAVIEWWRTRVAFRSEADGTTHTVGFEGDRTSPRLTLRSEPVVIIDYLTELLENEAYRSKRRDITTALQIARSLVTITRTNVETAQARRITDQITSLSRLLARILGNPRLPAPPVWIIRGGPILKLSGVQFLTSNVRGSGTNVESGARPHGWELLESRQLTRAQAGRVSWVRMHMITAQAGGSGRPENLVPAPSSTNTGRQVLFSSEAALIRLIRGRRPQSREQATGNVVWASTQVRETHAPYQESSGQPSYRFARRVSFEAGLHFYEVESRRWETDPTLQVSEDVRIPMPDFSTGARPSINVVGGTLMVRLGGVSAAFAVHIMRARERLGWFQNYRDFNLKMYRYWESIGRAPEEDFFRNNLINMRYALAEGPGRAFSFGQ